MINRHPNAINWHGYNDGALPTSAVHQAITFDGNLKVTTYDGRTFDCHPKVYACGINDSLIEAHDGAYPIRWED